LIEKRHGDLKKLKHTPSEPEPDGTARHCGKTTHQAAYKCRYQDQQHGGAT
jgi:hypothetical protein